MATLISQKSKFKTVAKSTNSIKVSFFKGNITSNLLEETTALGVCDDNSLQFNCDENSQYIPII
jgi:hypothetical protein